MLRIVLLILLFATSLFYKAYSEDLEENPMLTTSGDIIQIALPASGYIASLLTGDKKGQYMFYKAFLVNTAVTHAVKYIIDRPRPEGNGHYAFPSGHTSSAFQGAAFIERRYGWKWGIPSYLLATFVGYSRIEGESDMHDIWDVMGGAALGITSSYIFTDRYEKLPVNIGFSTENKKYALNLSIKF